MMTYLSNFPSATSNSDLIVHTYDFVGKRAGQQTYPRHYEDMTKTFQVYGYGTHPGRTSCIGPSGVVRILQCKTIQN